MSEYETPNQPKQPSNPVEKIKGLFKERGVPELNDLYILHGVTRAGQDSFSPKTSEYWTLMIADGGKKDKSFPFTEIRSVSLTKDEVEQGNKEIGKPRYYSKEEMRSGYTSSEKGWSLDVKISKVHSDNPQAHKHVFDMMFGGEKPEDWETMPRNVYEGPPSLERMVDLVDTRVKEKHPHIAAYIDSRVTKPHQ